MTYRTYLFYFKSPFDSYELRLNALTNDEATLLITKLISNNIKETYSKELGMVLNKVRNNPLGIVIGISLIRSEKLSRQNIHTVLYDKFYYDDPVLEEEIISSKIILPESPEIITKIALINSSLVEQVKKNPSFMFSMTSRQFEEFVAELFEKDGFNVSLTKQSRDGGKDIFIVENNRMGNFLYYLECKHFSQDVPVGVRLVRELYGTVVADRATAGLLVTSSYFSKEARDFTEQIKTQMSLMEYIDLKNWISST